jgi:hypothetical protein
MAKVRELADAAGDSGDAVFQLGQELLGAEYRIDRSLHQIRAALDEIDRERARGRETGGINGLSGGELVELLTSLGERNALIRAAKRLGVDVTAL